MVTERPASNQELQRRSEPIAADLTVPCRPTCKPGATQTIRVTCIVVRHLRSRKNLARYLDEAAGGRTPILVTRRGRKGNVVFLSED